MIGYYPKAIILISFMHATFTLFYFYICFNINNDIFFMLAFLIKIIQFN